MNSPVRVLFSVLLALLAVTVATAQEPDKVVARIGDVAVKFSELERRAAGELVELQTKRQQVLEAQLDRIVAQKVLELEAEARGTSPEALVRSEVDAKLSEPTDDEITKFYDDNRQRIPADVTFEQVRPEIRNYLMQQGRQIAYSGFIDTLKSRYGVSTSLDPLRLEVDAEGHPFWGPAQAPITIVEFSDFQCPYCSQLNTTIDEVRAKYPGKIRFVFRQFPLTSIHPHAMKAAEASLCAFEGGRFWELHDSMFSDQQALKLEDLRASAKDLDLDLEAFEQCLSSGRFTSRVEADLEAGRAVGVTGTPALFINGRPLMGLVSLEQISEVIDEELREAGSKPGSKF